MMIFHSYVKLPEGTTCNLPDPENHVKIPTARSKFGGNQDAQSAPKKTIQVGLWTHYKSELS